MKVGRLKGDNGAERLGMVVPVNGQEQVLDLEKAAKAKGGGLPFANTMSAFIDEGKRGLDLGYETAQWAQRERNPQWYAALNAVQWLIPVDTRTFLCAGRNFGRHRDESLGFWTKQGVNSVHFEFPTGFIQLPNTLVPHGATVACPEDVKEFDYEVEATAVIGKKIERVSEKKALEAIFGYTVFNDLSAREWQRKEMQNQMILVGKNFPGFGPIGPWILTADEVPDPSVLVLDLKVNGEKRQHELCSDMIFGFPQLVSFWSRVGLDRGDLIASGTPEGVAMHRKPDPFAFYLKSGDVVHASVAQIGVLETRIA
jgi:2-keto-4-pentenoate hydratase/2-oxohepta-3-ene-1,7-dioic acid hydratase in catechol pathway